MPNNRRKRPKDKESLLTVVRDTIKAEGDRPITMSRFFALSGMKSNDIYDHFESWNHVLRAAGLDVEPYNRRIDDATLLSDWAAVVRKLRSIPTKLQYNKHGKYSADAIQCRAGSWTRVPETFRAFAARRPQWKDVLPLLPSPLSQQRGRPVGKTQTTVDLLHASPVELIGPGLQARLAARKSGPVPNGRPVRGGHLGIGSMRNAPVNEMGVVCLFALLAPYLGFQIESLQSGFPDCEASCRISGSTWQSVRIEFEYESRKYRDHGHPFDGCDFIVCWTHNWPDCPKNIEVIDLSEEIKRLGRA